MSIGQLPAAEVAELKRLDVSHHLPGQTDYKLQAQLGGSRIITKASGCLIHDADGNEILDGMAGLWCVNAGYGRTELAKVAYEQMLELPYYNTFFKTASAPAVRLAAAVAGKLGNGIGFGRHAVLSFGCDW
jgi:putrescine aminotransferase